MNPTTSILTSWKKNLFWVLSFFFLLSTNNLVLATCNGISIQTDRNYNCGPGLFRIQLSGAQDAKQITWDFGDGERIAPDSIYQYISKNGFIDVRVKILWQDNSTCDTLFQDLIEIKSMPKPVFSFSRTILCDGPDTVTFFCNTPGASSISWIVDGTNYFNAGNKLVHRFASPGKKGFQVIYTDSFGCRGIVELKDTILVLEKVNIDFNVSDSGGCAPLKVIFYPKYDLKGQRVNQMYWKLTGIADSINAAQKVELEFKKAGEFNAALYILSDKKCLYKAEKRNYIKIGDSMPILLNKPKSYYCFNEPIVLADLNPKSGGKYTWRMPGNVKWQSDSSKSSILIKIRENGVYKVSVEYEKNGCITRASYQDSIIIKTVWADFGSMNNYHCEPPLEVNFKSNAFASDTGEILYYWTFFPQKNPSNPISVSSLKNPSTTFDSMGNYDVKLIAVHKQSGCSDTAVKSSFVRIDTIRPVIIVQPKVACVSQEVLLFNGTQPSTYAGPDSFHWTIYDTDGITILKESDSTHVTFQSNKAGVYPVKLYGGNPAACNLFATVFDTIEIIVPKLQFLNLPENACQGTPMRFYGATLPQRAKFTHFWEVYNKDSSYRFTTQDSMIQFRIPGDYDVKYSVQVGKGCRDSLIKKNAIGVNGVHAKLSLDTFTGCLPFRVNPKLENMLNYHKGVSDDQVKILWSCEPSSGVIISDGQSMKPEFLFTQVGAFIIKARLTNASGCDTILKSDTIFAGVDASFILSDDRVCLGAEIIATATSKLKPSSYKWLVNSTNVELSSVNNSLSILKSPFEGNYSVSLVAEKNKICYDTFTRFFSVIEVKAAFRSLDTLLTCAPVYAQFLSNSKNADQLIWNYGDGKPFITTLPSSGHIYTRNSGWSDGFDVSLIAVNKEGCSDTLLKEDFVWVLGPVPDVDLFEYRGCEPLQIKIKNHSRDAIRYIFDYGDNNAWDSATAPEHYTYRFTQVFGDTQRYELRVFAYDSMGCIAKFEPDEKIEVYRSPKVESKIISTNTCNYSNVLLQDLTKNTIAREWRIYDQGDTFLSQTANLNYIFTKVGQYLVELEASNYMNCTSVKRDSIYVYPEVTTNINRMDSACLNRVLNFSGTGVSGGRLKNANWEIELNELAIAGDTGFSGSVILSKPGNYQLTFIIENEFNCSDTAIEFIYIDDPDLALIPEISYVTVKNEKVDLYAQPSVNLRYLNREVRRNADVVGTSLNKNQTAWLNLNLEINKGDQCFQIIEEDICAYKKSSAWHCPVILRANASDYFKIDLNWTGYRGWDDLVAYRIFRSTDGKNFERIAELGSGDFRYTDSPLCPGTYYYFIEAVNQRGFLSHSNRVYEVPLYQTIIESLDIRDIRVENNNNQISIRWDKSNSARHASYELYKWGNQTKPLIVSVEDTFYADVQVEPTKATYKYEIRDRDVCGLSNAPGNHGQSILLTGMYLEDRSELDWNEYEKWDNGVLKYQVMIEKEQGFEAISDLATLSSFIDPVIYPDIRGDYCYKIKAVSAPDGRDTSISNHVCLIGASRVYIPNAFTPNMDGINDEFKPTLYFVRDIPSNSYQQYDFMVYNRWGEILFRTNQLSEGWNGTIKNDPVQAGVYGYAIQIYGLDGKTYFKSGQVHLIR